MSTLLPTTAGGAIAASDSAAISTQLDASGLPVGTFVWNAGVGSFFKKTVSTAALVTDQVLAVLNEVGTRWIIDTSGSNVQSVTASTANAIDNADPRNPIVKNVTTSTAGVMSAADKVILDGLYLVDPWYSQQAAFLKSKVSALTQFAPQKLGQYSLGSISAGVGFTAAGTIEGGSLSAANTSYTALGGPIYNDPKQPFGFAFQGILKVTSAGKIAVLGLTNGAGNSFAGATSEFDVDNTHYVLRFQSLTSACTIVNDGAKHTFAVTGPGGAGPIKLWVDGVDSGASITQSSVSTVIMGGAIRNTVAGDADGAKFLYGWV